MPKRRAGALLIIGGVALALLTMAVAIVGGTAAIAIGGPGYLLLIASVALLGVGVALLDVSGPIFDGARARRALKVLGFALVGDSVLLAALSLPGLEGSNWIVLYIPFFVFGWATIIGAVLTVRALWAAGGRSRVIGSLVLAAPVMLLGANASVNDPTGSGGTPLVAIAASAVAVGALLLGFMGLAWLGWENASSTVVIERAGEGDIG